MKLLGRQENLALSIENLRKETDVEHQRLSSKAVMLQETLKHMEYLNRLRATVQSESFHWLDVLSKALLDLEAKRAFLHPLLDGTTATLDSFSAINDAFNLLRSTMETAFGQLPNFFANVARESYSTDMLCAQITDTMTSFSGMASIARKSITNKRNGVLHPLRRLPKATLLQIFEQGADEEAQEWCKFFRNSPPNPKFLTRVAGVCRDWRSIALNSPQLWRRVLAPAYVEDYGKESILRLLGPAVERGIDHFRRALQLCKGVNLDLTIPAQFTFPPDVDITTLEVRYLGILDAGQALQAWPPVLPSPKHFWLGQSVVGNALSRSIPHSVLSNTSKITSYSLSLVFSSPISTVTHLVLCGLHSTLRFNDLLCFLPQLVILDAKDARLSHWPGNTIPQPHIHSQLRTLGVDWTGLNYLEQALVEGLRLPNLHLFEIANIDSTHLATEYPSIPTHLGGQITHVGIFGIFGIYGGVGGEALHAYIDIFPHLDTLSLHGTVTKPALQALCRAATSDEDNGDLKCSMPKTVQTVMICDYQEDGEAIHQRLQEIHASPAPNGEGIKIIFQDCLNIRLDIRKELC